MEPQKEVSMREVSIKTETGILKGKIKEILGDGDCSSHAVIASVMMLILFLPRHTPRDFPKQTEIFNRLCEYAFDNKNNYFSASLLRINIGAYAEKLNLAITNLDAIIKDIKRTGEVINAGSELFYEIACRLFNIEIHIYGHDREKNRTYQMGIPGGHIFPRKNNFRLKKSDGSDVDIPANLTPVYILNPSGHFDVMCTDTDLELIKRYNSLPLYYRWFTNFFVNTNYYLYVYNPSYFYQKDMTTALAMALGAQTLICGKNLYTKASTADTEKYKIWYNQQSLAKQPVAVPTAVPTNFKQLEYHAKLIYAREPEIPGFWEGDPGTRIPLNTPFLFKYHHNNDPIIPPLDFGVEIPPRKYDQFLQSLVEKAKQKSKDIPIREHQVFGTNPWTITESIIAYRNIVLAKDKRTINVYFHGWLFNNYKGGDLGGGRHPFVGLLPNGIIPINIKEHKEAESDLNFIPIGSVNFADQHFHSDEPDIRVNFGGDMAKIEFINPKDYTLFTVVCIDQLTNRIHISTIHINTPLNVLTQLQQQYPNAQGGGSIQDALNDEKQRLLDFSNYIMQKYN
jgi:hypothetical protein